ncbi:restriction endonuclease subunit S [uncultured Chryseobacterium sp.]|uniref:restriction endonuclease subunit S n=1 Tax=uncultured Chryseobacterium sp. TaxID=259322 RepID=UPI002600FB6B|nr:restriction endonuclease subunit S [uncultured Chryseobacterium sp.]
MIKNRTYLKNIACISAGKNAPKDDMFNNSNGLPFIRASHLNNLVLDSNTINRIPKVSLDIAQNLKLNIAPKGSILFAKSGMSATMNRVIKLDTDSYFVNHLACVKSNQEKLDSDYLKHFLHFYNPSNLIQGEAYPSINLNVISDLEIPLPPLSTQKAIAEKLGKADALRKKDQELLAQYDELAQAIFIEMFGDPVVNEKGWKQDTIISNSDCIVPGRDKPKSFSGNIPWITTDDMVHLGITNRSKKRIGLTKDEIDEVRAKVIPKDSIIITCVGDLGVISIVGTPMVVNQQLHSYQLNKTLDKYYVAYDLSYRKGFMLKMASTTTVPYMNKSVCNSIPINIPPIKLQNQFAKKIQIIEAQKTLVKLQAQHSEDLFQALLQESFNF